MSDFFKEFKPRPQDIVHLVVLACHVQGPQFNPQLCIKPGMAVHTYILRT